MEKELGRKRKGELTSLNGGYEGVLRKFFNTSSHGVVGDFCDVTDML